MQETWVPSLNQEDLTCRAANEPREPRAATTEAYAPEDQCPAKEATAMRSLRITPRE